MGVLDHHPEDYPLLNSVLQLDSVNSFTCNLGELTLERLNDWQNYLFDFDKTIAQTFKIDVSTKLHRIMGQLMDHILFRGFLDRASSGKTG